MHKALFIVPLVLLTANGLAQNSAPAPASDAQAPATTQPANPSSTSSPPATGASHAPAAAPPAKSKSHKPVHGLAPIPDVGGLPAIYSKNCELTAEELKQRAVVREYAQQIRLIRHKHFGQIKIAKTRAEGIAELQEFTDPAAFEPMIQELAREKDDVKLALLDHFAKQGDQGQAALAWEAIFDSSPGIRNEAAKRMVSPAPESVLYILNSALRSDRNDVVNNAASLTSALNVIDAIPLLIFAQAAVTDTGGGGGQGDLAWIAIQTERAFVSGLQPVVGDASGAFSPIVGILHEGVVLRVVDAVVIEYRTEVHNSLVNMTTNDWGQSTEAMGYNAKAWWAWYNQQYIPFKKQQEIEASLSAAPAAP